MNNAIGDILNSADPATRQFFIQTRSALNALYDDQNPDPVNSMFTEIGMIPIVISDGDVQTARLTEFLVAAGTIGAGATAIVAGRALLRA